VLTGAVVAVSVGLQRRATGTLVVEEPEFTLFLAEGASDASRRVEGKGPLVLKAGEHRLGGWWARRRDRRGQTWEVRTVPGEPSRPFRVAPHGQSRLTLAAQIEPFLYVEQSGPDLVFRLRLRAPYGETLGEVLLDGRPAPPPSLRIEDARGRVVGQLRFADTCGAGCARVWRPPAGLAPPLTAIPQVDLGPFPLATTAFRFRWDRRPPASEVAVGQTAPDFALPTADGGASIRLSSRRGQPVVLGFFCGCGLCQAAARRLAPEVAALGGELIAVVESERQLRPEQVTRFREVSGFRGPVLADRGGSVTRQYRAVECPRVWAIDGAGVVRYANPEPRTSPEVMAKEMAAVLRRGR
jgi:peroxiredoxin Q/BCP